MYDFVDRPVEQLAASDRATLAAIRRWVHALTVAGMVPTMAEDGFGAAMRLIDDGSADDLAIARPCAPLVGESEAILLALWRLVADGRHEAATGLAGMIVDPARAPRLIAAIAA